MMGVGILARQPGNRENIAVIETLGTFNQDIPPMAIHKGGNTFTNGIKERCQRIGLRRYLNGWTYAVLGCTWLQINFEPHRDVIHDIISDTLTGYRIIPKWLACYFMR